ncbi:unnamed protein product, partial [Laminaria digitata]
VYPDGYELFLSRLAVVNMDIGFVLSNSCIVSTNFFDKLLIATVGPPVALLALAFTYSLARKRNRHFDEAGIGVQHKHLSIVLFVAFFIYPSVSFTIFQTFICESLDDGETYLRADYSLTCTTSTYTASKVYAAIMVCVYPIGVPVGFGWWLANNRKQLQSWDRAATVHLQPFGGLWGAYRPGCYYYEVVEYGRRIVLTGAAVFILPDSAAQIAIVLLLAVVCMFIFESLSPFANRVDIWLYRWGNGIILASMYVALLLKVDLVGEDSQTSSAITALLIAANTSMVVTVLVQAILLVRGVFGSKEPF